MKPTIKIQFANMMEYQKKNNSVLKILGEKYHVELSETPDILFYNVYGSGVEHYKYHDCIKVFLGYEAAFPNFNECDYAIGRSDISFGDRYCRILDLHFEHLPLDRSEFCNETEERAFCNFIYSNASNGDGALLRQEFCKKLSEYKRVDCPGRVLNNMQADELRTRHDKEWESGKRAFLKKYKFTIAFENQGVEGYTTEKMIDPLAAGSIPVYWGDRRVTDVFNPRAFINVMEEGIDGAIAHIKEIDTDDTLFRQIQQQNSLLDESIRDVDWAKKRRDFILNIAENGTKLVNSGLLLNDSTAKYMVKHYKQVENAYQRKKRLGRLKERLNI